MDLHAQDLCVGSVNIYLYLYYFPLARGPAFTAGHMGLSCRDFLIPGKGYWEAYEKKKLGKVTLD